MEEEGAQVSGIPLVRTRLRGGLAWAVRAGSGPFRPHLRGPSKGPEGGGEQKLRQQGTQNTEDRAGATPSREPAPPLFQDSFIVLLPFSSEDKLHNHN